MRSEARRIDTEGGSSPAGPARGIDRHRGTAPAVLTIDCAACELQHTSACADCVVSFVCDRQAGEAVVIDVAEARAIRLLGSAGLVPVLRHRRRTG